VADFSISDLLRGNTIPDPDPKPVEPTFYDLIQRDIKNHPDWDVPENVGEYIQAFNETKANDTLVQNVAGATVAAVADGINLYQGAMVVHITAAGIDDFIKVVKAKQKQVGRIENLSLYNSIESRVPDGRTLPPG
jgi:hypothetical protein